MKTSLLAAVVFLFLHAPVPQNDNGTIEGMAQRADTKAPIAGVRVNVTSSPITGAPLYSAITGSDGHFAIADVPPGQYFIRAERDGYLADGSAINGAPVAAHQHLQVSTFNFIPAAAVGGRV